MKNYQISPKKREDVHRPMSVTHMDQSDTFSRRKLPVRTALGMLSNTETG